MARVVHSLPKLTRKQRDVMALVADNRTSKEIAARLDISESAVNQRIEMIRARLGGLPRGELARLYRLKYAPEADAVIAQDQTWQKIHLSESATAAQVGPADGIPSPRPPRLQLAESEIGDGSQLAAIFFAEENVWPGRAERAPALLRFGPIALIVLAALVIAVGVTNALGPVGGG